MGSAERVIPFDRESKPVIPFMEMLAILPPFNGQFPLWS